MMEGLPPCLVPLVRLTILQLHFVRAQGTVRIEFAPNLAPCKRVVPTVFISASVSADDVAGFVYVGVVVVAAMAAGLVSGPVRMAERRSSRLRMFFAAFRQMLSIFGAREIN